MPSQDFNLATRVESLEGWRHELEIALARADEREKRIEATILRLEESTRASLIEMKASNNKRFDRIDMFIGRGALIIITPLVAAVLGLAFKGVG